MNKYVVRFLDGYENAPTIVAADGFYSDQDSITFTKGLWVQGQPHPEAIALYRRVLSVKKIEDE